MIPGLCSIFYRGSVSTSGGLTAIASPYYNSGVSNQLTVGSAVATASGGTPPYTYLWTLAQGDPRATADSPASASTTFSVASLLPQDYVTSYYACTISDSAGNVAFTNLVSMVFFRN